MTVAPHPVCGVSAMRKLLAVLALVVTIGLPSFASALTSIDNSSTGLNNTAEAAFGSASIDGQQASLSWFIGDRLIKPALSLIGVLFFALMVYGGFTWMTARGNSKQVDKAKDIIVAAVIGAVIVSAAYALTTALFNSLSSGDINGSAATTTSSD